MLASTYIKLDHKYVYQFKYISAGGLPPSPPGVQNYLYHLYLAVSQAMLTPNTVQMVSQLAASRCTGVGQWYRGMGQRITHCPHLGLSVPSLKHQMVIIMENRMFLGMAEGEGRVANVQPPLVRCRGEEGGPVVSELVGRGGEGERKNGTIMTLFVIHLFLCLFR